jgi:hypothetical protein
MADRFDEGKDALDGVSPDADLWADAQRRVAEGPVVPLAPVNGTGTRRRRPAPWLAGAAAAVVALAAIGTAVVTADDDAPVDTGPSADGDGGLDPVLPTVYQAAGACKLGITGDPLPDPITVSPAETFVEGSVGTLIEGSLNTTQTFAVQVPGQVVTDLVGERVEDIELDRGTAQAWFQTDAVQVRWFTGSQEPCESFTATVAGGTEDENRHAAVELAERVLMGPELDDEVSEAYGIWPMTASESMLGYRPELIGTAEETALEFARVVLGWDDAEVSDSEPSEDGRNGSTFSISGRGGEGTVSVSVAAADPASDGHVVYRVSGEDVTSASIRVADGVGWIHLEGQPPGSTDARVRFINGEYAFEGTLADDITFAETGTWSDTTPGAVLVLFLDADGDVVSAWGRALPAGDFAAG